MSSICMHTCRRKSLPLGACHLHHHPHLATIAGERVLLPSPTLSSSIPPSVSWPYSPSMRMRTWPHWCHSSVKKNKLLIWPVGERRHIKLTTTSSSWLIFVLQKRDWSQHRAPQWAHQCGSKKGKWPNNQSLEQSVFAISLAIQKVCAISRPTEPRHIV